MEIFLVGGAVRDQLLGYPHHENDWVVVGGTPEQLLDQGYQPVGKDFPVFLHPETKEEYALARTERKTGPGYSGFDCFANPSVTLEEDLLRRDLTINAIAQNQLGELVDPYNGQQDIRDKVLRHTSPAFIEDPLRVLRVARFAARYAHLGFTVAPETLQLMQVISHSGELSALPAERIWKELERALSEQSPQVFFSTLQQCEALATLMPELPATNSRGYLALQTAAAQQCASTVRFALLFIDVTTDNAEQLCQNIRAPKDYRQLAIFISRYGQQLESAITDADEQLDLIENIDAFRKPERFEQFLQCGELLFPDSTATTQLRHALTACLQVDTKTIVATGIKGKAIAKELRRQRIQLITQKH